MECNNKLKINEYVSISQLKRKLKTYLVDKGYADFKPSGFSKGLVLSLVMILEELVADCLKNITKDNTGLYTINILILKNLLLETDKYNFCLKHSRKYNSVIKYHDSIFFNIKKVMDNLEIKHGTKLMIDSESKNMICYIILGLQYDIVNLALKMVKYANRKTLNNLVLEIICSHLLSDDLSVRIKLKLDSYNISNLNVNVNVNDNKELQLNNDNTEVKDDDSDKDNGEDDNGEDDNGEDDDDCDDDDDNGWDDSVNIKTLIDDKKEVVKNNKIETENINDDKKQIKKLSKIVKNK